MQCSFPRYVSMILGYSLTLPHLRFFFFFFLNDPAPPEISPLPLHAAFPICSMRSTRQTARRQRVPAPDGIRPAEESQTLLTAEPLDLDYEHEIIRRVHQEPDQAPAVRAEMRSEEHTSELQSLAYLVCRLLLE